MEPTGKLTIHDIAQLAGVSAGTVSRALNRQPGVGAETRERVLQIVREKGFKADVTARRLSTGRTRTIGIVFPLQVSEVVMHPVYPELLGALGDAAQRSDYDIMMFTTSTPHSVEHVIESVAGRRVDGLVLPAAGPGDPLVQYLADTATPAVLIGHRTSAPNIGWVDCTHDSACSELTLGLLANGRRRLTMINGPDHVSACGLRSRGFWDAVNGVGDAVDAEEITVEMTHEAGRAAALELMGRDTPPDGIVCGSDSIAGGVLDAAQLRGVAVPADLEVTGFDDTYFSRHSSPPLTTVRMPLRGAGEAALDLLIRMIEQTGLGGEALPREIVLPTAVVRRGSTRTA